MFYLTSKDNRVVVIAKQRVELPRRIHGYNISFAGILF